MAKSLLFLCFMFLFNSASFAQERKPGNISSKEIKINKVENGTLTGYPTDISLKVEKLFNPADIQISNISVSGGAGQAGVFDGGESAILIANGILLTSGGPEIASGPNDGEGSGKSAGGGSDIDLVANSAGISVFDACALEFDFTTTKNVLSIKYVFGSDEYEEYSCSNFNDAFGIFISGPGYSGKENIALIPGTYILVKINTVNQGSPGSNGNIINCSEEKEGSLAYSGFFVSNPVGSPDIEYDGFTKPLDATFLVIPGEKYHLKIVVADATDAIFDSGIFISYNNYIGDTLIKPRALAEAKKLGSGLYKFIGNAKYATTYSWDFGDGTTSNQKHPVNHKYASEGQYIVRFIASNFCCSDTSYINLDVKFTVLITNAIINHTSCSNTCDGVAEIQVEGGTPPYNYKWDTGVNSNLETLLCAGDYLITVSDSEGFISIIKITISDPDPIIINVFQTSNPDQPIVTKVTVSGGTPPYKYKWSDGKTGSVRYDLKKGQGYLVQVTDFYGCSAVYSKKGTQSIPKRIKPEIEFTISSRELVLNTLNVEDMSNEVKVFDYLGRQMWSGKYTGESSETISLNDWVSGIYFIHLITESEIIYKQVFIK